MKPLMMSLLVLLVFILGIYIGSMEVMDIDVDDEYQDYDGTFLVDFMEVSATNAPGIELVVKKDPKSGWNIFADTDNFEFAPEHVNLDHVKNEGYAVLLVDKARVARMYGPYYHIGKLGTGEHDIEVQLHTNNHKAYAVNGEVINDKVVVMQE